MSQKPDLVRVRSAHGVDETVARLKSIISEKGAIIFAHVDHQAGAQKVGMELAPSQLLIFGNPKLGTPFMQADLMNGLNLPMRVLVVEETPGDVTLNYTDPRAFCDAGDDQALAAAENIATALAGLTRAASGLG